MSSARDSMLRAGAAALGALVIAGCALTLPQRPARATRARPGSISSAVVASGSARVAVREFAQTYINWNAADVTVRLELLARASAGQARAEMALEAAETRTDTALHRGRIANAGSVEAVAALSGRARTYVVVTRERTTSSRNDSYAGLRPRWHLSLAEVTTEPIAGRGGRRRWVVSRWQPES